MSALLLASEAAGHAAESLGFPLLPALVLIPLVGALVILCIPAERDDTIRLVAVLTAIAAGATSIVLLTQFATGEPGFQFQSSATWIESLDIKLALGVDGISLFLVVLTGILFPISLLATKPDHNPKGYYFWLTALEVGCLGVFLALDLFAFFVFFELTLVPLYMLIGKWGHGRRVYAATKFFLFTMVGSVLMLVSIVAVAFAAKAGDGGTVTFDLVKIATSGRVPTGWAGALMFFGFVVAFAVKTPVFPFHTWLPDAHTEAPTAGSVDLAGVLLKLGTYGFLRFALYLFPVQAHDFAPVLLTLGVAGIIYGGAVAAMQKNLKRIVAYSSVAHMGFVVVGLFALNPQAIIGAILVMVNHGITTGALFVLLGFLYSRRHTYELSELRGIQKSAPVFAGIFTLVMLASVGLPGLNGFPGEFLVLLGTFIAHRWWAVVAAGGVIIAALYLLWAYQRVFHGTPDDANARFPDLRFSERAVMVPLILLIVGLGVYPKPLIDRMEPSVRALIVHIEEANPGWVAPTSEHGNDLSPVVVPAAASGGHEGEAEPGAGAHTATAEEGR